MVHAVIQNQDAVLLSIDNFSKPLPLKMSQIYLQLGAFSTHHREPPDEGGMAGKYQAGAFIFWVGSEKRVAFPVIGKAGVDEIVVLS